METQAMANRKEIGRGDIMPIDEYAKIRKERRPQLLAHKEPRRVPLGPHATCYFESYETMWHQIHEMLFIERGGDEQIDDELNAYNPLIPNGKELICTVMFEVNDPVRRKTLLSKLGGIEETMFLRFDGEQITGRPEEDVDRTTADGKASSVQFVHFLLSADQVSKFKTPGTEVTLGFAHPGYGHMTLLSEQTRAALAEDLD